MCLGHVRCDQIVYNVIICGNYTAKVFLSKFKLVSNTNNSRYHVKCSRNIEKYTRNKLFLKKTMHAIIHRGIVKRLYIDI